MRIISGSLKGRNLEIPKNIYIRPTQGKIKESIFSILENIGENNFIYENKKVIDICSGSGSLGFEALSRGAAHVSFVDIDINIINAIKRIADKFKVSDKVKLYNQDAKNLEYINYSYDLVFIDPPYEYSDILNRILIELIKNQLLNSGAIVILETSYNEDITIPSNYIINSERIYGKTKLIFLLYN